MGIVDWVVGIVRHMSLPLFSAIHFHYLVFFLSSFVYYLSFNLQCFSEFAPIFYCFLLAIGFLMILVPRGWGSICLFNKVWIGSAFSPLTFSCYLVTNLAIERHLKNYILSVGQWGILIVIRYINMRMTKRDTYVCVLCVCCAMTVTTDYT